jgi:hypothetical protein
MEDRNYLLICSNLSELKLAGRLTVLLKASFLKNLVISTLEQLKK